MHRRTFWEPADELVEKFLGANLEVERVSAVFDAYVEELRTGERYAMEVGQAGVH